MPDAPNDPPGVELPPDEITEPAAEVVLPPPAPVPSFLSFALKVVLGFIALATGFLSVWLIAHDGHVVRPPPPTPTLKPLTGPEGCASLRWHPADDAIQADLPEGVEARFPLELMTNCVLGAEAETQVRIWFTADGLACGMDVTAPEGRLTEIKACLLDRLVGTKIPALPSGDYATMDVAFQ